MLETPSPRTLDATYADARQRFLSAAQRAGATITSDMHPLIGREGEELAVDVATLGPDDAATVLVVVSATHGVEGFAGSALQSWWLDERSSTPHDTRVVLIHGLNPYGFSWVRRVNEDNIDLNRNFIDWSSAPANPDYDRLAHLLVPESWSEETQEATSTELLVLSAEHGFEWLQQSVTGGQYSQPRGVFYGGSKPAWSNEWLRTALPKLCGDATRVGIVDLHTGLGEWGHGELITHQAPGEPCYERGTAWWGEVRSNTTGESVSAALSGDWLSTLDELLPDAEVTAAALEFGTVDSITVLQSLRADAWLHGYGDPNGEGAGAIRAQVRAAFADDDPAWLATLIERFDTVANQAFTALAN